MIEVICGPMFSGKTTEMLRRVRRAEIAGIPVLLLKPALDTRVGDSHTSTHDQIKASCVTYSTEGLTTPEGLRAVIGKAEVIGIDEVQFFDADMAETIRSLSAEGRRFIVSGLDMNWQGKPYETMSWLLGIADKIKKLSAVCVVCGRDATRTKRKVVSEDAVLIGGSESYEARCAKCWADS